MKNCKRIILAAVLCLLSLSLFACGKGEKETDTLVPPPAPETKAEANERLISSPDGCGYVIILARDQSVEINSAANDLKEANYARTGKQLWVKRDDAQAEQENEILIGVSDRKESGNGVDALAKNEFRIRWVGTKLVLSGGCPASIIAAEKYLLNTYFKNADTDRITIPADLDYTGEIDMKNAVDLVSGWSSLTYHAQNGVDLLYQIWFPRGYDAAKNYPCILYMHSAGVRCSDNSHIYTGEAKFLRNFESSRYANEAIVIAPCCPTTDKWVPAAAWNQITYDYTTTQPTRYMAAVTELFDFYREQLSIDENRLYTYGMSMGGFAVWDLVTRHPGLFAAAIPVAGAGDPTAVSSMGKTAFWIFHGDADTVVPVGSGRAMRDALTAAGRTDIRYTEFAGAGHGIWVATADTAGLFDWLFAQKLS